MTMSPPEPSVARFFGAALIAVGFLMMLLCGGCGALFFVTFLVGGIASSNHEDISMVIMPIVLGGVCLLYTSPSPRDRTRSRMPSSA